MLNERLRSTRKRSGPSPRGKRPTLISLLFSNAYVRTLQTPLLGGRDFTHSDDMKSLKVMMIVNQAFAQQYFPGKDVLGKKLRPGSSNGTPSGPPRRENVAVVRPHNTRGLRRCIFRSANLQTGVACILWCARRWIR